MAIIKCKICGGDIELSPDKTFGTCEYCGTTMTLPRIDDEQRAAAFNRGNHFRRQGEFDKALAVYERIVAEDDADAEAHWCCALCRFGIEYVEDPATYEYLPTCHRASFDSILEDVDYLAALEHSDGITRRQYQKDAAKIAEVQRGILATSQKEEPFDVFICYKETDETTGERSRDSLDAQEVYYQLTEKGYRVFFSRITLEDKAGSEYEPYIFAALNSAKVMIAIGEKPEHFAAVWVKNEWSRFLALMKKDRSRLLLPCYKNMDPYDLPEQLAVLQSYDMGKIGFMQDLIRGVEKVLRKDEPKAAQEAQPVVREVVQSAGGANLTAQLKRGQQALEDGDWTAADGFFDKALDMDAECAEAFFGKALAAARCSSGEALIRQRLAIPVTETETITACEFDSSSVEGAVQAYTVPGYYESEDVRKAFSYDRRGYSSLTRAWKERIAQEQVYWERDRLMSRAIRYSNGEFAETMKDLRKRVDTALRQSLAKSEAADEKRKNETAQCYAEEMDAAKKAAKAKCEIAMKQREADYSSYCEAQSNANTIGEYLRIAECFEKRGMHGYADCDMRAEQCRKDAIRLKEELEEAEAQALLKKSKKAKSYCAIAVATTVIAIAAVLIVTLVVIPGNKYRTAETLLADGDYDGAAMMFAALGNYKDSSDRVLSVYYSIAEDLLADGYFDRAVAAFSSLGDYRDSMARAEEARNAKEEARLAAGYISINSIRDYRYNIERHSIGGGYHHTVGLRTDGTVVATGENNYGQCDVSDWTDIVSISVGFCHTVGLRSNGTVVAVGDNTYSQCDVSSWTDIITIAAGGNLTVGLRADGKIMWTGEGYVFNDMFGAEQWTNIVAIATGGAHLVGLRTDGTVVAVGFNEDGRCDVNGWTDIAAITVGGSYTFGLRADGTVEAVGNNGNGQCDVIDWMDIVAIAAGRGLCADGTVVAVGDNSEGQCEVGGWTDIVEVAVGYYHTIGLRADGTVVAIGNNDYGQCDVADWTDIKLPNA